MPRFFVNPQNVSGETIKVTGEDVNHIKNVLRIKCGDNIVLCDGLGNDYTVSIEKFDKDEILTKILEFSPSETEPPICITLCQAMPKSDKMDLIIQKSVELGVNRIIPVITDRTVVKLDSAKDAENKVKRWQRIALEAAKQSNRGIIPVIEAPISFNKALEQCKQNDISFIPYENEVVGSLMKDIRGISLKSISVFIGPEGGFTEKEIEIAIKSGVKPVTLGPRILRTETAGLMVLSILMYELGDVSR